VESRITIFILENEVAHMLRWRKDLEIRNLVKEDIKILRLLKKINRK
jgi:hypothetical protein